MSKVIVITVPFAKLEAAVQEAKDAGRRILAVSARTGKTERYILATQ